MKNLCNSDSILAPTTLSALRWLIYCIFCKIDKKSGDFFSYMNPNSLTVNYFRFQGRDHQFTKNGCNFICSKKGLCEMFPSISISLCLVRLTFHWIRVSTKLRWNSRSFEIFMIFCACSWFISENGHNFSSHFSQFTSNFF